MCCNKNYDQGFIKKLKERFFNSYELKSTDHRNNKFIILLRECLYPHECMDDEEKFNETPLPGKEGFYSDLNMEDTTDADYAHAKIVLKILK